MKLALAFLATLLASPAMAQLAYAPIPGTAQCGLLKGANLNTTADQPITLTGNNPNYRVTAVYVANPSAAVTTAAGGIYTAAAKAGLAVVAAGQAYSGLTSVGPNTAGSLISLTVVNGNLTANPLYFSLTTAEGAARTADIYVHCSPLP
jgi:hypothetical protein